MSQRLIHIVPPYYRKNKEANGIFGAVEGESERLIAFALDVIRQGNPKTATWGLNQWEKEVGLPVAPESVPLESQRAKVIARLNVPDVITPLAMQRMIRDYTKNKQAQIVEYGREKRFEIIADLDQIADFDGMSQMVYEMRPKHLSYSISGRVETNTIVISVSARQYDIEYPICGEFYPEDDLEGRIYQETLLLGATERHYSVEYPVCNEFYSEEGV